MIMSHSTVYKLHYTQISMSVVQTMVAVIKTVLTLKVAITVAVMMDMYWLIMNSIVTVSTYTCLIIVC